MRYHSQVVTAKIIDGRNNETRLSQTSPSLQTERAVKANNDLQRSTSHKVNNPFQNGSAGHAQQIFVWIISWLNKSNKSTYFFVNSHFKKYFPPILNIQSWVIGEGVMISKIENCKYQDRDYLWYFFVAEVDLYISLPLMQWYEPISNHNACTNAQTHTSFISDLWRGVRKCSLVALQQNVCMYTTIKTFFADNTIAHLKWTSWQLICHAEDHWDLGS